MERQNYVHLRISLSFSSLFFDAPIKLQYVENIGCHREIIL